jgi:hypothetical protein
VKEADMMTRTIVSLGAALLVAAAARTATASCSLGANISVSVQKYWPAGNITTSTFGDLRCDNLGASCHLSGWLYKPTTSGAHAAIVYETNAQTTEQRFDTCEIVNHYVAAGYVVFVPYARGTDDTSASDPNAPGNGFQNTGVNWTNPPLGTDTVDYLSEEAADLQAAVVWLQGRSYVDPHRVAVMGSGVGGVRAAFLMSLSTFMIPPAAMIDLSGGVWDWANSPSWAQELDTAAAQHVGAVLYQQVDNENGGNYTPMAEQFTNADNGHPAKLQLYAPFVVSASAQTICTSRGFGASRCTSFTWVTDHTLVMRWIGTVDSFLVEYGVQ